MQTFSTEVTSGNRNETGRSPAQGALPWCRHRHGCPAALLEGLAVLRRERVRRQPPALGRSSPRAGLSCTSTSPEVSHPAAHTWEGVGREWRSGPAPCPAPGPPWTHIAGWLLALLPPPRPRVSVSEKHPVSQTQSVSSLRNHNL